MKHVAQGCDGLHETDDTVKDIWLTIPRCEFAADYERRLGWREGEQDLREGHYKIFFEEHLEYPGRQQKTIDDILAQLALMPCLNFTQIRKINATSPADHMTTSRQLQVAFLAQELEWTL